MEHTLIRLAEARTPRYTSYPTAVQFTDQVGPDHAATWLTDLPQSTPVSLYVHVPFCRQICWYCACNMKLAGSDGPLLTYASDLLHEIKLVAATLPRSAQVVRVHWGGGTPTSLPPLAMHRLMEAIETRFRLTRSAEMAVEIDPRTFSAEMARTLGDIGTNRVSFGVQEFDSRVQEAVNRIQPYTMVRDTVAMIRDVGISRVNFDLMYGLPYQTTTTLRRSIEQAASLAPDRVSLFGYAHVPWVAKRQRMIPDNALPDAAERIEQAALAASLLQQAGYVRVGLDHFARPDDPLVSAMDQRRLVRNFQGYSDDPATALVGIGATSISSMPGGFYQNISETGAWARSVREGELPVARGVVLTADDRMRGEVISSLMCYMDADIDAILARRQRGPASLDDALARLTPFIEAGLATLNGRYLSVTEAGRPAVRMIAALFDAHLERTAGTKRHAVSV